jgi:prolyl-tRNA editing enzyme YbaK/EbsC (Cys-tRNA(Pro) deacylase)
VYGLALMGDQLTELLAATGADHEIFECDPELADTAQFCEAYGFSLEQSANTILVIGKSEPPVYAACIVLAHTRLDVNKVVRKRLGVKKASFANGEATAELTGMEIGGVTPFGLPDALPIWVDSRVMACDRIVLGGGDRGRKVLAGPEILAAIGADVVEDLAKLPPPA